MNVLMILLEPHPLRLDLHPYATCGLSSNIRRHTTTLQQDGLYSSLQVVLDLGGFIGCKRFIQTHGSQARCKGVTRTDPIHDWRRSCLARLASSGRGSRVTHSLQLRRLPTNHKCKSLRISMHSSTSQGPSQ